MTREEAKTYTKPFIGARMPISTIKNDVEYCIDKIYDDFESRTCENCKYTEHAGGFEGVYLKCNNSRSENFDFRAPRDFGCNKFERKIDGNV